MPCASPPIRRIGILGGGQLGRMMGLAGIPLGLDFRFLDPGLNACAAVVGDLLNAGFSDIEAARELARSVDVATFDFENVPQETAEAFEEICPLYPASDALGACQDRLVEKTLLTDLGIGVADYHAVAGRTDLLEGVERLGYPAVLKTRRLGYDGKGQVVLRDPEDLERAWQRLGGRELILEAFVPFQAECSLVGVRGHDGEERFWPLTRNVHDHGILALSRPGDFDAALQAAAEDKVRRLLRHFDYRGVLTVEFFLRDGELLANEIAPRVHNSGHWTIDGSSCSQFENHVRAVAGLPLGPTDLARHSLMFNWIGRLPDRERMLAFSGLHWHEYGKEPRPGRKIGHATLTAESRESLMETAVDVASAAGGDFLRLVESLD
ncbi:MAG: 5-(carboxyamino)imidazole ribonucleotide synthase [Xanthomonadales bacterium]|jgi:5-(carboxyamino)imidazole ribonucleotide synthase|nr:5-(carboxyamino)imidazole ribonucleotide synthase [Xanthomonadales bacterium]